MRLLSCCTGREDRSPLVDQKLKEIFSRSCHTLESYLFGTDVDLKIYTEFSMDDNTGRLYDYMNSFSKIFVMEEYHKNKILKNMPAWKVTDDLKNKFIILGIPDINLYSSVPYGEQIKDVTEKIEHFLNNYFFPVIEYGL